MTARDLGDGQLSADTHWKWSKGLRRWVKVEDWKPLSTYADGTGGHTHTGPSKARAEREAEDGTLAYRQERTFRIVQECGRDGITVAGLANLTGWHWGQASGALSLLHKDEHVLALAERRDRFSVYVTPEHLDGRPTRARGHSRGYTAGYEQALQDVRDGKVTP